MVKGRSSFRLRELETSTVELSLNSKPSKRWLEKAKSGFRTLDLELEMVELFLEVLELMEEEETLMLLLLEVLELLEEEKMFLEGYIWENELVGE